MPLCAHKIQTETPVEEFIRQAERMLEEPGRSGPIRHILREAIQFGKRYIAQRSELLRLRLELDARDGRKVFPTRATEHPGVIVKQAKPLDGAIWRGKQI